MLPMPIPSLAAGASTRFHTSTLTEAGHPERSAVKAFMAQMYAERYGVRATVTWPAG